MTGQAWYLTYFSPAYWSSAQHEYTPDRTEREVAYLADRLHAFAPGRKVIDLGCGLGRHTVALARRGFDMVGVDVSSWALDRAAERARQAGVDVTWRQMDLLRDPLAPLPRVDAAICVQAFGFGSDADQLRLLRGVRNRLVAGGVLILDHSSVTAILRSYQPSARFEADGTTYEFERGYDLCTARSSGVLRVRLPDGEIIELHDDIRLYHPAEVSALLRAAGYHVEQAEADFTVSAAPRMDTRYVQFVARHTGGVAPPLAATAYASHEPRAGALDLRWSPDEIQFVLPAVGRAWDKVAGGSGDALASRARDYAVTDPYCARRGAAALAKHFGRPIASAQATFGAGTTGILHAIAALALDNGACVSPFGHPDLAAWVHRLGAPVIPADPFDDLDNALTAIARHRPALVVLDSPDVRGRVCSPEVIGSLAAAAADVDAIVIVDEAQANYFGPAASAAHLIDDWENLVVLRSVSKAYCCGGLRVGYALGSCGSMRRVRAVCPPLAVSTVAADLALELLAQGDVFEHLRSRIAQVKPVVTIALRQLGLQVEPGDQRLPWVVARNPRQVREVLGPRGIVGKELPTAIPQPAPQQLVKIAVPLSDERQTRFGTALERWIGIRDLGT